MSHCDRPDRIVSYPTAAPRVMGTIRLPSAAELREGTCDCEACGERMAPSEVRDHLESDCGGAAWKRRELLARAAL